jgi:hypothetical protein
MQNESQAAISESVWSRFFFGYGARSSCHVWTNRYTENAADETMQFVQSYGITISITIWLW